MSTKRKSLGSWFPNASLIKSNSYNPTDKICICLFYQYVKPLWTEERKNAAISYIEKHAERLNVGGRVRVGTEGLNATISSTEQSIREFTKCLGDFDEHFKGTDFKYMDNLPLDRAFKELKVLPVKELVYYGIHAKEELAEGGVHLEPKDYHKKLAEDNTVVIDVRNAYESDIGRFGAQQKVGGAELLVPDMRKSTDFPAWIEREEIKEKLEGKNVLMYCTGGVRCERASALLKSKFGDSVSGVYQLQGGIEKYLQEFPDGGYWQGKNFVFDKREAIGVGCFEGVGGIVQAGKNPNLHAAAAAKEKSKKSSSVEANEAGTDSAEGKAEVMGRCCVCEAPWDRYVGKKKCTMCGVPVLLCVACSSAKGMLDKAEKEKSTAAATTTAPDQSTEACEGSTKTDAKKDSGKLSKRQRIKAQEAEKKRQKEEQLQQKLRVLRCPLCVAENITVPADQIVFTANGTRAVHLSAMEESEGGGYYEHSAVSASNKIPAFTAPASTTQPANKKIKFGESGAETVVPVVAKAASTVCKWGGGYSAREEKGKSAKKRKLGVTVGADGGVQKINRPCMYGKECTRGEACWFQH